MTEAATLPLWSGAKNSEATIKVTKPASDYELTQAASVGDMAAFETLYERHNRRVYSLCLRMTANTAEEGHEHEEVARMLGCSVGTSKSQLHKARMKLRILLKQGSTKRKK
ncbi:MAG: hypothetical protein LC754_18440 [Acidobacteria bacterium]|nr:hypothetical protein [Acidobacteriota bacterium]